MFFQIQEKPDGKWRLTKDNYDMGVFESRQEAEAGMKRIINPQIFRYDAKGVQTE